MSKKSGNFFEEHIEKIVFAIVGLVCLWLLITRVLISPNVVSYDNKKFGAGSIDNYISRQAELLEDKLNREPEPGRLYDPCFPRFIALVDSAISDIDVGLDWPLPPPISPDVTVKRAFRIPRIPEVNDVSVEHIRAVAYVPVEQIDEENIYEQAKYEPNDIDFVTVEAEFDVAQLYERFYESFAGEDVPEEWRDPCLAQPVFAVVQLQRRQLGAEGSWSDWQVVPRTRIEHRGKMFEVIEEVEKLPPGGIKLRLFQFDDPQVKMDLLQPLAYRVASAEEEWFPPRLHKKFVKHREDVGLRERRQAREAEKEERERGREEARAERSSRISRTRTPGGVGGEFTGPGGFGGVPSMPTFGGGMPAKRMPTKRNRSEKERPERRKDVSATTSDDDIYEELDEILITEKSDFAGMREPLVFWAHDDTVEPEKSYRYRIRLGVFNPIAGTDQFSDQGKRLKNKVILWSKFSDETEAVEIPARLYFFPTEIQEASKTVTVKVSRYVLGYWYGQKFNVKQGEVIGKVVEYEPTEAEKQENVTVPDTVDYSAGAVLVDVVPVNDWSVGGGKSLRARYYFDMFYSFDGTGIEHMPIKPKYWPRELQVRFNAIGKSEKEPKKPLRDWGSRPGRRKRLPQQQLPDQIPGGPSEMPGIL